MSYSRDQRIQAMDSTLALALHELGHQEIQNSRFWMDQEPFDGVAKTTWIDLEQGDFQLIRLVRRLGGHVGFYLTGAGWRRALDVTGRLSDPEFEIDLSSLFQRRIQDRVKRIRSSTIAPFVISSELEKPGYSPLTSPPSNQS